MNVSAHRINDILRERYEVEVDFTSSVEDLRYLMDHYRARREALVESQGSDAAINSPDYVKYHLIFEAVRVFLREIAPRRINKKRKKSS